MGEQWLTEIEAAAVLHKSAATVQRLRLKGQLAFVPGRPPLIARSVLDDYLTRHQIVVKPVRAHTRVRAISR